MGETNFERRQLEIPTIGYLMPKNQIVQSNTVTRHSGRPKSQELRVLQINTQQRSL